MGAKSAVKLRNRGVAFKCSICGRKLMTPDALVAHQRTTHNIVTKRRVKPKPPAKPIKTPKTRVKEVNESKAPKKQNEEEFVKARENIKIKKNMVEFECPKCFKRFPTYFPALKHIQKLHCVDKNDVTVGPNHPSLIQPLRVELCLKCDLKVKSIQTHICDGPSKEEAGKKEPMCNVCEECFPSKKELICHVLLLHAENVESMFFPTNAEFTKWKADMEQQTTASYAAPVKYDSKQYYHCNYIKENQDNTSHCCLSTIVAQEFSKGIQVHFYKQHYKHSSNEYRLSKKYKKYSITSFMKRSDDYSNLKNVKSDGNDLYMQFKSLMEGIVVDAAKINIATLKILLGKALEITSILTNYDEDNDEYVSVVRANEIMTDTQIARALEEPLSKRKNHENVVLPHYKRPKLDNDDTTEMSSAVTEMSLKIVNSFSLAEPDVAKIIKKNCKAEEVKEATKDSDAVKDVFETAVEKNVKETEKNVNGEDTPSSFNESYQHFVVKNFPNMETISSRTRSKPVVKTRIGQFKPTMSPIKKVNAEPMDDNNKVTSATEVDQKPKTVETIKDDRNIKQTNKNQNVSSTSVTPKAQTVAKSKLARVSLDKPKVDFEYEVKEQEDDCNILILKL